MDVPSAAFLRDQRDEILHDWEARVSTRVGEDRSAIRDHVPKLLEAMYRLGSGVPPHDVPQIGQLHAWIRARQGWDVNEIACELSELRKAIWTVYGDNTGHDAIPLRLLAVVDEVLAQFSEMTLAAFVAHQQRSLEESEARLRAVLDHAPSVIYVKEPPEFRYQLVNQAFLELSGVSRDEVLGRTDAELRPGVAETATWVANDEHVHATGEACVVEEELVIDGVVRTFLTVKFPFSIGAESPSVCGISTEITSQKRLEAARERFVAVLGHDLRNPVTAISMTAALLLRRGGLDLDQQRLVRRVADSADRIARLAADLLDVTRSALGAGLQIEPEPTDLGATATLVVDEIRAAHPLRRIQLETDGNCHGEWDSGRVAQALSNLVANAVQHGADPIDVRVLGREDHVLVEVTNQGEPIPSEDLPRLFEPFTHFAPDTANGRVGLGLGIVNAIARAHGATVQASSDPERGTTFAIAWPRR